MDKDECRHYDDCSAPICPIEPSENLAKYIWYPDEEICQVKKLWPRLIVKTQRRIVKISSNPDRYFNALMLMRNCVIGRGMEGLDPDRDEEPQIETWLKKHPPKRQKSQEEINEMRRTFKERLLSER